MTLLITLNLAKISPYPYYHLHPLLPYLQEIVLSLLQATHLLDYHLLLSHFNLYLLQLQQRPLLSLKYLTLLLNVWLLFH